MFTNLAWISILFVAILAPFVFAKLKSHSIDLPEAILCSVLMGVTVTSCFYIGKSAKISDTQIISGEIVDKKREEGSYEKSYDCNCVDGKCQTCWKTIYTIDWYAIANVGKIQIDSVESESRLVYNRADPDRYKQVIIGEPASVKSTFRNYVAASSNSTLNNRSVDPAYEKLMPQYPDNIYDFYRINRVITIGKTIVNPNDWNIKLAHNMKKWGPKNKGNVILIFTDFPNRGFTESLKNHWLQGKQNDVVVVFGLDGEKILWNSVFSWTSNEMFKLEMTDALATIENVTQQDEIFQVIDTHMSKFSYRDMGVDFEYLDATVSPNDFWLVIALFMGTVISMIAVVFKRKHMR